MPSDALRACSRIAYRELSSLRVAADQHTTKIEGHAMTDAGRIAALGAALSKSICFGCSRRFDDNSPEALRDARNCVNCRDQRAALSSTGSAPSMASALRDIGQRCAMAHAAFLVRNDAQTAALFGELNRIALVALQAQEGRSDG